MNLLLYLCPCISGRDFWEQDLPFSHVTPDFLHGGWATRLPARSECVYWMAVPTECTVASLGFYLTEESRIPQY